MAYELSRGGYVVTTDASRLDIDYIRERWMERGDSAVYQEAAP